MIQEECFRYIWAVNLQGIILSFILSWTTTVITFIGIYYFILFKKLKNGK